MRDDCGFERDDSTAFVERGFNFPFEFEDGRHFDYVLCDALALRLSSSCILLQIFFQAFAVRLARFALFFCPRALRFIRAFSPCSALSGAGEVGSARAGNSKTTLCGMTPDIIFADLSPDALAQLLPSQSAQPQTGFLSRSPPLNPL